jgi:hypothetical protein
MTGLYTFKCHEAEDKKEEAWRGRREKRRGERKR